MMNCTPFVRQYDILNNKWGAVHDTKDSSYYFLPNFYKEYFLMKAVVEGIFRGHKWKQWQKNGKIKLIESK